MGIRGLTTFMHQNPHLFTDHSLHDCKIVIDGNNLCHKLYRDCRIDPYLGGDYNVFLAELRKYFETFRKCHVETYVLLDGAYDVFDKKLNTTIGRSKQRLSALINVSKGSYGHGVLPILGLEVLVRALKELQVPFARCYFEADEEIVALANRLRCPVLSQDSDFYVFDVHGGYVEFDNLCMSIRTCKDDNGIVQYRYLAAKMYNVDRLLGCFQSLHKSVLPIFGALAGNDYVNVEIFDSFLSSVRLPKKIDSEIQLCGHSNGLIRILAWLQTLTTEEAISRVLSYVASDKRERVEAAIAATLQRYMECDRFLMKRFGLETVEDETDEVLVSKDGVSLSRYFCEQFRDGLVHPHCLNAFLNRRVFLLAQVEDWSQKSAYCCSTMIRRIMYGIVSSENDEERDSKIRIQEYSRCAGTVRSDCIEPIFQLPRFGKLPNLSNLIDLTPSRKLELFLEVFLVKDVAFISSSPRDWRLFVCVLVYWLQKAEKIVTSSFLDAVLVTALHIDVLSPKKPTVKDKNPNIKAHAAVRRLFKQIYCSAEEFSACKERLNKFWHPPRINNARAPDVEALHWFAELQTCLMFASCLNGILLRPFAEFQPARFLCGTFLYNLYQDLKSRVNPENMIEELLGKNSISFTLLTEIRMAILEQVPGDRLSHRSGVQKRKVTRKRRIKVTTGTRNEYVKEGYDDKSSESQIRYLISCETDNKFADLNVDVCD